MKQPAAVRDVNRLPGPTSSISYRICPRGTGAAFATPAALVAPARPAAVGAITAAVSADIAPESAFRRDGDRVGGPKRCFIWASRSKSHARERRTEHCRYLAEAVGAVSAYETEEQSIEPIADSLHPGPIEERAVTGRVIVVSEQEGANPGCVRTQYCEVPGRISQSGAAK